MPDAKLNDVLMNNALMSDVQLSNVCVKRSSSMPARSAHPEFFQLGPIDLEVYHNEILVILGPSGCGKSTLLRAIAGLEHLVTGDIVLNGINVTKTPVEHRGIGMVFQQPLLFPHLTVEDNVAFGLKMQGMSKHKRIARAEELLISVDLAGFSKRMPSELSGGQQQRVALARAIALQPSLILMDEPFSSLDPKLREDMGKLVVRLHKQFEMSVIFVTHDQEEAFRIAHRIGVMEAGALKQLGTPRELYESPRHVSVASFLGVRNMWRGKLTTGRFICNDLVIELSDALTKPAASDTHDVPSDTHDVLSDTHDVLDPQELSTVWCMLRPEAFSLLSTCEAIPQPRLLGVVEEIQYRQGFVQLTLTVATETIYMIEKSTTTLPHVGDSVMLTYDSRYVWILHE